MRPSNGTETTHLSTLLTVHELAFAFSLPEDEFRAALIRQGIDINREQRLPLAVAHQALQAELGNWRPKTLTKLR